MPKKPNRLVVGVQALWTKFKSTIDWYESNMRYFAWAGKLLFSRWSLGLAAAFGVVAPQTAENLKHTVLGDELAQSVEVVDSVTGTEGEVHGPE